MDGLKGKCVVVTGGASGIGLKTVKLLMSEGATVVILDYSPEKSKAAELQLTEIGGEFYIKPFNLADVELHEEVIESIERDIAPIDILINNAGISEYYSIEDMTPELWDRMMDINIRGTFFLTQVVYKRMKSRGFGRVISLASLAGERGARFAGAHYSVSKAGVIMLTKVFALSAADCGVTFNSVSPGLINTEMTVSLGSTVDPKDLLLNRMGSAEDVANVIVFLASDAASYMTGQNISVNGGQSMR